MSRFARTGLAVAALVLATPLSSAPLAAQELAEGTWTGSITTPDAAFDIQFEVAGEGEELAVTMIILEAGQEMPFETVELVDDMLTLGFVLPNVTVTCELAGNEDGSYAGECVGSDGEGGHMTMVPPADG
ncbi:MAG: hypothetical protein OEU54_11030 [Gemmatimonadota bacterium]|nr:hypothetical protein [Gemmatimonadota bacterium]